MKVHPVLETQLKRHNSSLSDPHRMDNLSKLSQLALSGNRNPMTMSKDASLLTMADEVVERLARLEEQMRHVVNAVERLANRDVELDVSLRAISDKFNDSLAAQAELFRASLRDVTERFVSRDDWSFWRNLLTAALLALVAYGWSSMVGLR